MLQFVAGRLPTAQGHLLEGLLSRARAEPETKGSPMPDTDRDRGPLYASLLTVEPYLASSLRGSTVGFGI